jgi:hypothetical protein
MDGSSGARLWTLPDDRVDAVWRSLDSVASRYRRRTGRDIPAHAIPSAPELHEMLQCVFWASLLPDEHRYPRFSVFFGPPEEGCIQLVPRVLSSGALARLAPATAAPARLGIWRGEGGGLSIWGIHPGGTTFLEVRAVGAGHVLVSLAAQNLAVLKCDEWRLLIRTTPGLGAHGLGREHVVAEIATALGETQGAGKGALTAVALTMALDAMRAKRHGGTLLVLPETAARRSSALRWLVMGDTQLQSRLGLTNVYERFLPAVEGASRPLDALLQTDIAPYLLGKPENAHPALLQSCSILAQLGAVDGAVVLTESLDLLAFGVVIQAPGGGEAHRSEARLRTRSILAAADQPGEPLSTDAPRIGGTRRRSAARFVANNRGSLALTASQDGAATAVLWRGTAREALRLTEIETLLD